MYSYSLTPWCSLQVSGLSGLLASSSTDWHLLKPSSDVEVDPGYLSEPVSIEFPTDGGLTSFMNYYAPKNKDYAFPQGELPALVGDDWMTYWVTAGHTNDQRVQC
jgi:hypothetical protein